MKKSELVITVFISIALGIGLILALIGNPLSQARALTVPPAEPEATLEPALDSLSPVNQTSTPTSIPIGPALKPANPAGADYADVLLLYSDFLPTNFSVNFCALATYYGLGCQRLPVDYTDISDELLRDESGNTYKLIGIDAILLQEDRNLLTADELSLLKSLVDAGRTNLLVSKVDARVSAFSLSVLTDGAVSGAEQVEDSDKDWRISANRPDVTREFSGYNIVAAQSTSSPSYGLVITNDEPITQLVMAKDAFGNPYPVFIQYQPSATGSIFLDAGEDGNSLEQIPLREMFYSAARFSQVVPTMMTIRYAMGDEVWHNPKNYANLAIDRGILIESPQSINYTALLYFMRVHNFHTSVALIPADWEISDPHVIAMLVTNPEYFSLVQYGNNADGYEFYYYDDAEIDRSIASILPARPFEEQEWDIQEGVARMEMHRSRTLIPYDKIMVFPFGICPEPTLAYLKRTGYLATVTDDELPLGASLPNALDYGMYPASLDFGNFPILTRRLPAETQAYQPYLLMSLMDLFIDKPALFFTYPYSGGLFPGEMDAFNPIADELNRIEGGIEWRSLGDILRHLYLQKLNDDGSVDVRIYSREILLENTGAGERAYHIAKSETLNVPIARLTVNGHEFPYRVADGILHLDVLIPAGQTATIEIIYENAAP